MIPTIKIKTKTTVITKSSSHSGTGYNKNYNNNNTTSHNAKSTLQNKPTNVQVTLTGPVSQDQLF